MHQQEECYPVPHLKDNGGAMALVEHTKCSINIVSGVSTDGNMLNDSTRGAGTVVIFLLLMYCVNIIDVNSK